MGHPRLVPDPRLTSSRHARRHTNSRFVLFPGYPPPRVGRCALHMGNGTTPSGSRPSSDLSVSFPRRRESRLVARPGYPFPGYDGVRGTWAMGQPRLGYDPHLTSSCHSREGGNPGLWCVLDTRLCGCDGVPCTWAMGQPRWRHDLRLASSRHARQYENLGVVASPGYPPPRV
jgi:hypothetical protein